MSKVTAVAVAAAGTSAVSLGGYYLIKNGSGGENGTQKTTQSQTTPDLLANANTYDSNSSPKPLDLSTFKANPVNNNECVKELFPTNEGTVTLNGNDSTTSFPTNFFGDTPTENTSTTTKGCLIINYERKTKENNKGSGAFTGTGIFIINNSKGFINFNSATTTADNKLKLDGGFYLVEKSTSNSTASWAVKGKDEITSSNKQLTSNDLETKFPKRKNTFTVGDNNNKDYWGFIGENVNATSTPITYKGTWSKETDGTIGISDGGKDLNGWNNMYTTTKSNSFDLTNILASFKGTGTQSSTGTPPQ